MVKANIVQISDALMIVVNVGRVFENERTRSKENDRRFI